MTAAFVLQFLAATLMTGIIWMVQIVHYPLFKNVGIEQFKGYQNRHTKLITYVVGPTMTVGLVTALAFFKVGYLSGMDYTLYIITFAILILIWLSTYLIQAPQHKKLSLGYNLKAINNLINFNWIRTACWSVRCLILSYLMFELIAV